ncbi:MAG: NrfD/PsrC family molybdoenzyme membrane anchor subunit [Candidatus Zixiibacteriota bacterium]
MTKRTLVFKDVLWVIALAGLVAAALRLWFGLGATTNLSDSLPWGFWKILNMVGGVALSTSGFTVGFLVYVLRLERFRPFVKPAILIAFLGYGCSCLALLFDIGLPHRFWHPILMWNFNSFLFEVFWCVLLYFTVTVIELAPTIFERFRAEKIVKFLHQIALVVVIIGISLSSLHHSSLGSLFLVSPQRLHALWYSPLLPLLFIISAMGAGLMVVVLARILWARWYDSESVFGPKIDKPTPVIYIVNGSTNGLFRLGPEGPEMPRIRSLASIAAGLLGVFFGLKILDLFLQDAWGPLLAGTWESWVLLAEMGLLAVIPLLLMIIPATRKSPVGVAMAAGSAVLGLALNRLNVGIFGYFHNAAELYFPSLIEWAVTLAVVAAAGLVFFFIAEHFPIFSNFPPAERSQAGLFRLPFGSLRQMWNTVLTDSLHRVSLIAVFVIPLAFILMYPPYYSDPDADQLVRPASGVDRERTVLDIDGNHNGLRTEFAHAEHQKRLGDSASCDKCHHVSLPNDKSTPCSRCHRHMNAPSCIFNHENHLKFVAEDARLAGWRPENHSCLQCHPDDSPKTAANAKDCLTCHDKNMFLSGHFLADIDLKQANSFMEAMHLTCVECHKKEADRLDKPHLSDCSTCHELLRARPMPESSLL